MIWLSVLRRKKPENESKDAIEQKKPRFGGVFDYRFAPIKGGKAGIFGVKTTQFASAYFGIKKKKTLDLQGLSVVEVAGFEPAAFWSRTAALTTILYMFIAFL